MQNSEQNDDESWSSQHGAKLPVSRRSLSDDEFRRQYYGEPLPHNDKACQALKEYERKAQYRDEYMYEQLTDDKGRKINGRRLNTKALPPVSMSEIAAKYGVTIEEMKQHWRCVENGG
jgi:hypothetical protein